MVIKAEGSRLWCAICERAAYYRVVSQSLVHTELRLGSIHGR